MASENRVQKFALRNRFNSSLTYGLVNHTHKGVFRADSFIYAYNPSTLRLFNPVPFLNLLEVASPASFIQAFTEPFVLLLSSLPAFP